MRWLPEPAVKIEPATELEAAAQISSSDFASDVAICGNRTCKQLQRISASYMG